MNLSGYELKTVREDGEFILYRASGKSQTGGNLCPLLVLAPASEHPVPATLRKMEHEFSLKAELDRVWAVQPLALTPYQGRSTLLLEDPGGQPLNELVGAPMELRLFLRLAIALAAAAAEVHRRGVIHKNIKPAHVLVDASTGQVWLTGFGIASRLHRERQSPQPPEFIAGTLAYMAPEQTGRMNRSIDSRSDLYSLGVTLYEMATGSLPFTASDRMKWVHCHIARQPMPPSERVINLPAQVSAIIMKLLAKTAEDRYQTAAGLERDLRRCLAQWETEGRVGDFALGEHDTPDRLLIPEKLYGRSREIATLLAAFERIAQGGEPELVLVSGYSGIGKSSVVNELHKVLVPRGLFASGKFDQYKRDIPYATLAQAFQSLIRPLLAKSEAELGRWRDALGEAVGPNGRLMVDLVPELKLIIGEQAPVPEVPARDAQGRFELVFRRFLGVFARPEHPLALFLDDLQWLDAATLDLLEHLMTQTEVQHFLLIGAYRDNEVTSVHPLMRKLEAIRKAGAFVQEIFLAPLGREDLGRLVADSLYCDQERAAPLAQLMHQKTAGNPFFVIQFLMALTEDGLVGFDHRAARWSWDLPRIHAKAFTDNVVDLMVGKLRRLPANTQNAVRQLACLGDSADIALLAMIYKGSKENLHGDIEEALRTGLVLQSESAYKFLHDRVREAAYSLIPEAERAKAHLRIGRLLAAQTPPEKLEEAIFEIVNQLNRSAALITSRDEREQLARLNLVAGRRAKVSTAYASALSYLVAGTALLADNGWEHRPDLMFPLELHRAECEFLIGELPAAEKRLADLAHRASSLPDLATVTRDRVDLFMTLGRSDHAVAVGLDYLRSAGIDWSNHPSRNDVQKEYAEIWRQLGDRRIEALLELPRMTDPDARATMDVLTSLVSPALFTDENLRALVIGRMGNLSLKHGNCDTSCYAYTAVGNVLGLYFGDYKSAYRLGQLGLDLVEQSGTDRLRARVYVAFGNLAIPSRRHLGVGSSLARHAFDMAQRAGDLTYAAFSCNSLLTELLAKGDSLAEVQREAEAGLDFARKARFELVVALITAPLQLTRMLRGLTTKFGSFDDAEFDVGRFEQQVEREPSLAIAACLYWIRKLQARVFAGDHAVAVAVARKAERLLWMSPAIFERADYHLYHALALAALCDEAPAAERADHRKTLAAHCYQLQEWADNCPENFTNRAALVAAEIARLEGRELDAERLYEQAIRSARDNRFVHNQALANELAARFYAARGFETVSKAYLRNARHCYLHWGADGKVRQLDQLYPDLRTEEVAAAPSGTIETPVEHLDLATVIKVSQTISSEMVLGKLLDTLMRTAIEHAGAERALLILSREPEQRIAAEATTRGETVIVELRDAPVTVSVLPESVLHYVIHTHESVILDDASILHPFSTDAYIRRHQARSVLCLPLLNQAKLIGVLYLENNLAARVFAPARVAVLKLLASQAAISFENSRLYQDLAEREAKIRRLVDANIIGIFIWDFDGRILDANEAFLSMLGRRREDFVTGGLRWTEITPADWCEHDAKVMHEHKKTGLAQPFETEFTHKDGSRVPVLIGVATFEEGGAQGVAFVLDITARKRAEEELRKSRNELEFKVKERTGQLSKANEDLQFMNKELEAFAYSVSHDLRAPIRHIAGFTELLQKYADPVLDDKSRHYVGMILDAANRMGCLVDDLLGFSRISRAETLKTTIHLEELVKEVVREIASNAQGRRIRWRIGTLPICYGDPSMLRLVFSNLISNAVKFTRTRPSAEIEIDSLYRSAAEVVVFVKDNGVGFDMKYEDKLFGVFQRLHSQEAFEGTGIGLATVQRIVHRHGGRVWGEGSVDKGATFYVAVPKPAQVNP
jgi:PAS domain S-box-containing protein